mmetsp:Transcript_10550/g.13347  ORF Transcript_10550/g.13347 Transcript_10550/m.13347 type:complete len:92 (+) Transcript_10550:359-634(+)
MNVCMRACVCIYICLFVVPKLVEVGGKEFVMEIDIISVFMYMIQAMMMTTTTIESLHYTTSEYAAAASMKVFSTSIVEHCIWSRIQQWSSF